MSLEQSPLEEDMPLFDDVFSEQDGVDFNTLLQSMKDEFLKTLNLSDIPTQDSAKVDPPEYMLELYNKFATDRTSMPSANIIRSFKNEGKFLLMKFGLDFFQDMISKFTMHGNDIGKAKYIYTRLLNTYGYTKTRHILVYTIYIVISEPQ